MCVCVNALFSSPSSPLLSGNPLKCVCENMWIKLRLQEDIDSTESQELKCIDDKAVRRAISRFSPPDCGNVNPRERQAYRRGTTLNML